MPFRRDLDAGCPVGTTIRIVGKPYQDVKNSIEMTLSTNNNDIALRIKLKLGGQSKLKIDCVVSQKTSTAIENPVTASENCQMKLEVKTLQHSFQIVFNDAKVADFVHRVDPTLIKSIYLNGPLITDEVVISAAVAPPLPSYQQATSPPIELLNNMSLGGQEKVPINDLPPPPASVLASAPQLPVSSNPNTSASSSFYYTGNAQGFSAHPYPLTGMIDNSTHVSQPNPANPLPTVLPTVPTAPPVPISQPAAPLPPPASTIPLSRPPTVPYTSPYANTPTATSSVPYTVTFPQSASSTPAIPQPIPQPVPQQFPQQPFPPMQAQNLQNPMYQNQMQRPYQPYPYPAQAGAQMAQQPTVIPGQVLPYQQAPMMTMVAPQAPPTYVYPQTAVQPIIQYPVYQQYPGYGYSEVIYYDGGHHHHHHRHHHHCD
uniref:Galectin n=1 Tax=Caenorhabditis japonica TaxID=281687 RepID=A0A8R1E6B1_CAEJA